MAYRDSNDKPLGESLGWRRTATSRPYQSHWHNLRQDRVTLPDGQEITFTYQEHPGFVTVVPVTDDNQIIMLRCYRYAVDEWCWELPAGGLGDKPGLSMEEVARQELAEETGATCRSMEMAGWFYAMNGTSDARCTFFIAKGAEVNGATNLEATEQSEVHLVPMAQAMQMARDGRISDGVSALALLRCEPMLMGKHRNLEVVAYDPLWPLLFEAEAARLAVVFGDRLAAIHHMGSTSVPGIWAKPVVDIMPVVYDIETVDGVNDAMCALGYVPKGEYGIAGRRFFNVSDGERRVFNVHVYEVGNPEISKHLDFVEYLRNHPDAADAYGALKRELAQRFPDQIDSYTNGKTDFIVSVRDMAQHDKETRADG
ncbi:MAG: GrpB family protein [Caldilineales bacterium]